MAMHVVFGILVTSHLFPLVALTNRISHVSWCLHPLVEMGNLLGKLVSKVARVYRLLIPGTQDVIPEADKVKVNSTLKRMFPLSHDRVPEADKRKLARKKLCTRSDLDIFVGNERAFTALARLSPMTRCLLLRGRQSIQLIVMRCHLASGLMRFASCQRPSASANSAIPCRKWLVLSQGSH